MFIISKLVGALTDLFNLTFLILLLGGILLRSRRHKALGRRLLGGLFAFVVLLAVFPFEQIFSTWLENRFPTPDAMPDHVDGIIVLGGGLNPVLSAARGRPAVNSSATRMTALIPLAKRYPNAKLVFTGGAGALLEQRFKEATYVREFYDEIGFDHRRITFEDQSRNTRENALFTKNLMEPKPGETWLLITSAFHMTRSVGCFRAVDWFVIPYPVDYHTTGKDWLNLSNLRFSVGAGLGGLSMVGHELVGLVGYRLSGWTAELLPHP